MNKSLGVVHAMAESKNCGWGSQNYMNAQALAAKHAKHYHHKVVVEVTLSGFYDARADDPPPASLAATP